MHKRLFWLISVSCALAMGCNDDSNHAADNPPADDTGTEIPPDEDGDGNEDGENDDPVVTCDEICVVGQTRCTDTGSQICELINECPDWGEITPCAQCNENTGECIHCDNPCTANEKKCDDKSVWTCVTGDDTCTHWEQTQVCADNEMCEDAQCVLGCKDECTENETSCIGIGMQKCVKNEANCLVWQMVEECDVGQICSEDGTKCEYACGDDCDPFSIVLIPDTQYYTESRAKGKKDANGTKITTSNSPMTKQMEWIAKNKTDKNIRFVIHLGDITNGNVTQQWKDSVVAMKKLAAASVPFSISTGNHDYYVGKDTLLPSRSKSKFTTYYSASNLKDYFKGSKLADMKWYGEQYGGANSYSTFSVGNIHFLVFAFEFYPRKDVVAWADSILNKPEYSDYHVIVETHGYVASGGNYCGQQVSASTHYQAHGMGGQALFDEFVRRHSNIFMVVAGHSPGAEYLTHNNLFGTPVHEILVDYQSEAPCQEKLCKNGECISKARANGGNGWFRLLQIDPKTGHVTGSTHSVIAKNKYYYGSNDPNQHFFCTKKYGLKASDDSHKNDFTFDIRPQRHQYDDTDIYGFVPRDLNNVEKGNQTHPVVAVNRSDGSFVGVWEDSSTTADSYDIALRMFKRGGYAKAKQRFVTADNKTAKGDQKTPDIAMDKDGNFVVVWADDSDSNKKFDILMTGFNSEGEILFSNLKVNESSDGDHTVPKVAMAADGRFVVTWNDKQGNDNINIKYRSFNADGTAVGEEQYLIEKTAGTRRNSDIAMDENGNYVVVWDDDEDNDGVYQMHAQKYDFSGQALGDVIVVNSESTGQHVNGAVGMNPKGAFYVVYREERKKGSSSVYAIRARGWDENLNEIMPDTDVYYEEHNNDQPTVCIDDSNRAVVGFHDANSAGGDVILTTISNATVGDFVSSTKLISNNQTNPSVGCTGDGHVVVVYADDAEGNKYYETYVRGFNKIEDIHK